MKLKIVLVLLFVSNHLLAQNFYADFKEALNTNNEEKQLSVLKQWELNDSNDPELYTSYYNYHYRRAHHSYIEINTSQTSNNGFTLSDSLGNEVGYLEQRHTYDKVELEKAVAIIDKGIQKHPNRLDMRFGKIYLLGSVELWHEFTEEILRTIEYSSKNNNEWLWTLDEKIADGEGTLLGSIQDYQVQLFETENDDLLSKVRQIAEKILSYYPKDVQSISNIAVTYLYTEQYDKGLEQLLKAEKIKPDDTIVLSNIARTYELKNDVESAKLYYNKIISIGDEDEKEFAQYKLSQLQ